MARRIYLSLRNGSSDYLFYSPADPTGIGTTSDGIFYNAATYDPNDTRGVLAYLDSTSVDIGYISCPSYLHGGVAASPTKLCVLPSSNGDGYVTPGDGQVGYSTTDHGETWSSFTLPYSGDWNKVIWTGTKFVAILERRWQAGAFVVTNLGAQSTDGVTWTSITLPTPARVWTDIAFSDTAGYLLAASGTNFTTTSYIYRSTNLSAWTLVDSALTPMRIGADSARVYYASDPGQNGTYIQSSPNGTAWDSNYTFAAMGAFGFTTDGTLQIYPYNNDFNYTTGISGLAWSNDRFASWNVGTMLDPMRDPTGTPVSAPFFGAGNVTTNSMSSYYNYYYPGTTQNRNVQAAVWDGERFVAFGFEYFMWPTDPADFAVSWSTQLISPLDFINTPFTDSAITAKQGNTANYATASLIATAVMDAPVVVSPLGDLLVTEDSTVSITAVQVFLGQLDAIQEQSVLIEAVQPGVATLILIEDEIFTADGVVPNYGILDAIDAEPTFSATATIMSVGTLTLEEDFFFGAVGDVLPSGFMVVSEDQSFTITGYLGARLNATQEASFTAYGEVLRPNALVVTDAEPTFSALGGATLGVAQDAAFTATGKVSILGALSVAAAEPLFSAAGEVTLTGSLGVMQSSTFAAVGGGVLDVTALAPTFSAVGPAGAVGSLSAVQLASFSASGDALAVIGQMSVTQPAMYANYGDLLVVEAQSFVASDDSVASNLVAYAMNIKSAETTVYTNYDFSYIVRIGFDYYGVKPDGLYLLTGTKDNGVAIKSTFTTAETDFGTSAHKRVPQVYIDSEDKTTIQPVVDGKVGVAHPSSYKGRRTTLARGYTGKIWQVKVTNVGGAPIKVGALELLAEVTSRKI